MVEIGHDVGFPHWVFGESCFAFIDGGRVAFRFTRGRAPPPRRAEADGTVTPLELPFTQVATVAGHGSTSLLVAATPTTELHGAASRRSTARPIVETVVPRRDLGLDDSWWSVPEPVEFPTGDGASPTPCCTTPHNPEWAGPPTTGRR